MIADLEQATIKVSGFADNAEYTANLTQCHRRLETPILARTLSQRQPATVSAILTT
jgi:hypothetical protein